MGKVIPIEGERRIVQEPRIKLLPFDEIKLNTRALYLVSTLIPQKGLAVIWGAPKCGKSFFALDMLLRVSLEWDYRGLRVHGGPVVYCAFEGQSGIARRIEAFRQRFMTEQTGEVPFFLVTIPLDLVKDHHELIAAIRSQLGGNTPVAVALDTLNRSLHGSESKDEDMSAYVNAADAIKDAFDCAVLVIHHCGHNDARPRGHSSLIAAADVQIKVSRDAADNIVAEVEFAKDGPQGQLVVSRLEIVDLGVDDEGDPITSCVVIASDDRAPVKPLPQRRLSDRCKLALDALTALIARQGEPLSASLGLPQGILAVPTSSWREELFARGVIDRDGANPREDFKRVSNTLKRRDLVAERDGKIWLIHS